MPTIKIEDAGSQPEVTTGLTKQFDDLIDRVRRRAYELFEQRGGKHGSDLEDWFRAEEELLFPAKFEVTQEPGSYNLSISLPGVTLQNLRIYTLENGLVVKNKARRARSGPENQYANGSRAIFYWWPLPTGANVPGIAAELKHNRLQIKIPVIPKVQSADVKKTAA